jgi:predicted nucleic acid-binding Zn ribbon protein
MPIYLYKCEHCQVLTQVIRKVKDIDVPPGEPDDDKVVSECKEAGHSWSRQATAASIKLIGNWFGTGGY